MIKDLLLHMLTILFPVILIQALFLDRFHLRKTKRVQLLIGLMCGISACVCMAFPVNLLNGFIWDYRWIPLTVAILYGGFGAGGLAVAISILFRISIGGPALYFAVIGNLLFVIIPFLLVKRFYTHNKRQRIMVFVSVSMLAYTYVIVNMSFFLAYNRMLPALFTFKYFFLLAGVIQLMLTLFSMYIVEKAIELSEFRRGVLQVEKYALISELAASVAHEVRNPLTVVRGFISLAKNSMDDKGKFYMTTAIEELDRAEFIITDYLSFAKPQEDRVQLVYVSEMLANIIPLMTSFATMRGVVVEHHVESNLHITGDEIKLKQVMINLIKNAVEAIPDGGIVEVRAVRENRHILIQVRDNGIGMTQEQLKQLGQAYFSTKEKGTGIGLRVAFQIIQAMGGKLMFDSVRGKGTTATIRLESTARRFEE